MDFDLPDDHELLRRTVREFAEGEVAPVAEELDRTKAFPYEIVRKMGELGWMGIPFPEAVGGAGNVKTRARQDGGDWVIDGAKQFITNAGTDISGVVCITARTAEN